MGAYIHKERVIVASDSFKTIARAAETTYRQLSSKFLVYAYPVETESEIKEYLDALRKRWFDATHHCYAWRLGPQGEQFRANDDGEPSSTAGKPILGQLLSNEVTNCLVVVVRYFGGTKLGVPGLIAAYKAVNVALYTDKLALNITVIELPKILLGVVYPCVYRA